MTPSQEPVSPHGAEPSYPAAPRGVEPSYPAAPQGPEPSYPPPPPRAEPSYLIPPLDAALQVGGWEPPPPPPQPEVRPWRRTVSVGALTVLVIALAGVPLGLIWTWLAPSVPVLNAGANGIVVNDPSPEEYIAADGWFAILGCAFGLIVAITAWLVLRRHRGPVLLLGVVVGALGAAATAWGVGREVGLHAYEQWQQSSSPGATYSAPPDLHAYGTLLVPAFVAVIVLTLMAGWSSDPDLKRPGARPGPGRGAEPQPSPPEEGQSAPQVGQPGVLPPAAG
ncbi:DUF2567 domain-containing protein [Krasilnikovia sp. M28-CT-15]|uniref:DUF2567 domain-containing protein n=1 Tax=Krasilnikovia sp. M28-CT-15 TaxID=3373540 RepID=UPI003876C782